MSKLTRYAKNGPTKEIALVRNATGEMANSPEQALANLRVIAPAMYPGFRRGWQRSPVTNRNSQNSTM